MDRGNFPQHVAFQKWSFSSLFTVLWDHLLIQLNQVCAYEKGLKKTISKTSSHNHVTSRKFLAKFT